MNIELKNRLNQINTNEKISKFIKELNNSLSENIIDNLDNEQQEKLKNMRIEGCTYEVTELHDDCEDWRTILTNQETGETFQEIEFPHDIYHQVGVGSLVKYENGRYHVVEGTSIYELYPDTIENYCNKDGYYITKNGKFETADELYDSLNVNNKKDIQTLLKNIFEKIFYKLNKK